MSRSNTRPNSLEDEEYPFPAPLHERIGAGRGLLKRQPTTASSSANTTRATSTGRGLLANRHNQVILPTPTPGACTSSSRPPRTSKTEAIRAIHLNFPGNISVDDVAACEENPPEAEESGAEVSENGDANDDDSELSASDVEEMDSSTSETEEESDHEPVSVASLVSPSGIAWKREKERGGRQPIRNVCNERSSVRVGIHPHSKKEAFLLLLSGVIETSSLYTNQEGRRLAASHGVEWKHVSEDEFHAFLGLHILAGAFKATHRDAREMWSDRDGQPVFRATMSYERFCQVKAALRFDNRLRRDPSDPLAPVREIINSFNTALKAVYEPGPFLCVDEQLIEFHGGVKFKQYIPTKPGKFGIKVFWRQ
jgi:hypothetical protein